MDINYLYFAAILIPLTFINRTLTAINLGWKPQAEPTKDPEVFERVTKLVNEELKNFFRPEFLNRIDEIVVFNHLTRIDIWEISALMIKSVQDRLKEKGINLIVNDAVQGFLTEEGYDPIYGARPLRRAIMKYLEDTLAEQCLSKTLYPNTKIHVDLIRQRVDGKDVKEIKVRIDYSDVDPNLLTGEMNEEEEFSTDVTKSETLSSDDNSPNGSDLDLNDSNLEDDELQPTMGGGRPTRFFKKKD